MSGIQQKEIIGLGHDNAQVEVEAEHDDGLPNAPLPVLDIDRNTLEGRRMLVPKQCLAHFDAGVDLLIQLGVSQEDILKCANDYIWQLGAKYESATRTVGDLLGWIRRGLPGQSIGGLLALLKDDSEGTEAARIVELAGVYEDVQRLVRAAGGPVGG